MVPQVVEFMKNENKQVRMPAIRLCGSISTGTDEQTENVLQAGALQSVRTNFEDEPTSLQKEMAWFISNVTAGTKTQAQSVIEAGLLPSLIKHAKLGEYIVRKEATWALSNLTSLCDDDLVSSLISAGGIEALLSVLNVIPEGRIVQICLEGIYNILKTKANTLDKLEETKVIIRENGGVEILETLVCSDNFDIKNTASEILTNYFPDSESIGDKDMPDFSDLEKEENSSHSKDELTAQTHAHKYMQGISRDNEKDDRSTEERKNQGKRSEGEINDKKDNNRENSEIQEVDFEADESDVEDIKEDTDNDNEINDL
ncbi:hypothetical protein SK128_016738 [Halocaridina rubra]|uniref:Uncharacterized protein n=1 Tax=Halocaridina rubra TaxID=373956 RepID=A0AAN8WEJ7_HALRR